MGAGRTWYKVLQVDPDAEPEVIEAAYRRLAKKYHPDIAGSSDGGARMKEITAAYAVLRDPLQRAAYDRELLDQQAPPLDDLDEDEVEGDDWAPAAAGPPLLACRQHPMTPASGYCSECEVVLCGPCLDRFTPPNCSACVQAWIRGRRNQLRIPASNSALPGGLTARAIALLVGYVVASFPCGWRVIQFAGADDLDNPLWPLAIATVLGPVIAPFRIGKIVLRDLPELRRLEALVTAEG